MTPKVETWLALARDDLEFALEVLQNRKRPYYAAHLCQQAIEKLIKAIVQHRVGEIPQRTHNFHTLCQQAKLELPEEKMSWQLFAETKDIFAWLQETYLK